MIEPSVLRAMLAAGATAEMIVAAVEADYEADEKKKAVKRAQDAERQRKKRRGDPRSGDSHSEDSRSVTRTQRTDEESVAARGPDDSCVSHEDGTDKKERPPHPQKKTNTPPNEAKASLPPNSVSTNAKSTVSRGSTSRGNASRGTETKTKRGTRLPQDWHPIDPLWTWGKDKLELGEDVLRFETGAFRDHFWGAPGQKGVKLDWNATWKNWMREAVRRRGRARGGSPANANDEATRGEVWRKAVRDVEAGQGKANDGEVNNGKVRGGEAGDGGVTRDQ